jgi:hypothetical protein
MGLCSDKSLTFLKGIGYNVVRHPNGDVKPLGLIGVQQGEPIYLGALNLLITNPPGPLPQLTTDVPAADINGRSSSSLKIGVGANILGSLIGAMGGNLGVNVNYTNARTIEFSYAGVLNDLAVPLEVGNYLKSADVDAENLVLKQYVLGNGDLFLITKTAKSKKFSVKYEKSNGVDASVDVPTLNGLVGGNVKVGTTSSGSSTVSFEGVADLVFAFQAFRVGLADGELSLTNAGAGGVFLSVTGGGGDKPPLLPADGLLDLAILR